MDVIGQRKIAARRRRRREDAPRALMIAAPRWATSGMNVPVSQVSGFPDLLGGAAAVDHRVVEVGVLVAEWLPQMVRCSMAVTGTDSLAGSR